MSTQLLCLPIVLDCFYPVKDKVLASRKVTSEAKVQLSQRANKGQQLAFSALWPYVFLSMRPVHSHLRRLQRLEADPPPVSSFLFAKAAHLTLATSQG